MNSFIDGSMYKRMLQNAATLVENQEQALNALNVFPVPDGDTGSNMAMTLRYAADNLEEYQNDKVGKMAEKAGMLLTRGSHGNSGVITSLFFSGIAKHLKGAETADSTLFAAAMKSGVDTAYSMVNKPVEGTILTVARKSAAHAVHVAENGDLSVMFAQTVQAAQAALEETPKENPVLAKAGVVDAGGKGFCFILEAMEAALRGEEIQRTASAAAKAPKAAADFSEFATEDIRFGYCTELIVLRSDPSLDPQPLRKFLEARGDSLVLVADGEIIKIHVHTNHPGKVLEVCLKYGQLSSIKIENMRQQHTAKLELSEEKDEREVIAPPEKRYGFVAVCAGEGVSTAFRELGADQIVEGGQTMNPSTEDILSKINMTPSEVVFVLPNNKNIIMAAQQAVAFTEKQVIVLPTRTIPEGIAAMSVFDETLSPQEAEQQMNAAYAQTKTGHITYAARDSVFDGISIQEGDYLALCGGKMVATGASLEQVAAELAERLELADASMITVFSGEDADQVACQTVEGALTAKAGKWTEVATVNGGQPVYYFIIGVDY